MGCRRSVAGAISWFFSEVEFGVILEEDVRVEPIFFEICSQVNEKFSADQHILGINAFYPEPRSSNWHSCMHKTKLVLPWGWATWSRAWAKFDPEMSRWAQLGIWQRVALVKANAGSELAYVYYELILALVRQGKISSWAFPWLISVWTAKGDFLSLSCNLSKNVGFDSDATNTSREGSRFEDFPITRDVDAPIGRADTLEVSVARDFRLMNFYFRQSNLVRLSRLAVSVVVPRTLFFAVRRIFR
jgi:hypothetical protein